MSLVSFIIPCYRSEKTIGGVVNEINSAMAGLPGYEHEILLVNDCYLTTPLKPYPLWQRRTAALSPLTLQRISVSTRH